MALGLLAGCGAETPSSPTTSVTSTTSSASAGELVARAEVLSKDGGPPVLCLGGSTASLPPSCTGPPVVGWDWEAAPPSQEQAGIRWGDYAVVGRWDGTAFTLTRKPTTTEAFDGKVPPRDPNADLGTPCAPPPGGFVVVDAAKATSAALDATGEAAKSLPGYGGLWVDEPAIPLDASPYPDVNKLLVLNVKVTQDPAGAEAAIRRTWGGRLCVSGAKRTEAELTAILDRIVAAKPAGLLSWGVDPLTEHVNIDVIHDDGSLQGSLDAKYGAGLVRVGSELFPYAKR